MRWERWRLLIVVSFSGFIGLLFDQILAFMLVAVLVYSIWLEHNWYKLWFWLQKPKKRRSPSAVGVIDDVCRKIEQMRQQNNNRKNRLTGYLKRFQAATAALPDAIIVLGKNGEVEWANHASRQLLGVSWPRDNGLRLKNLLRDPALQQLLDDPEQYGGFTNVKSPLDRDVQLELKLLNYQGSGRMLIARDVTQTIKLQRMRRDFVANVSHELKTPLTVLRGYVEALSEDSDVKQWGMALPAMRQQTERMHLLIKDLLVLSQLETGEKPLRMVPVDIENFLQSILDDAKSIEEFDAHILKLNISSDKWLVCDIDEMRSAISNLVYNAIKYTPAGCVVTINWYEANGFFIEVADQGEGIEEHHIERLTERFYRVDKGRSRDAGGTGLGLAIVKHVLQRHRGKLKIESELGAGSKFICCLPDSVGINKIVD